MLLLNNITKIYHNKRGDYEALKNFSLSFAENKGLTFILGPSGSGKSTILAIMAREDQDYEGYVQESGKVVYISQEFRLMENMSLLENLLIIDDDIEKIMSFIKELGLEDSCHAKVFKLSNGQKKRVELIKALLLQPDILLLDELCSALDYEVKHKVMHILKQFASKMLVIMVSHDDDLAGEYADRIIRLHKGKIIEDKKIHEEVIEDYPKSDLKKSIKDHFRLTKMELHSRKLYYLLTVLVLVFSLSAILIGVNMYQTIRANNTELNVFTYGRNIITSQNDLSQSSGKLNFCLFDAMDRRCNYIAYFDIYTPHLLSSFIEEHPEIIMVRASWNQNKIKGEDFYKEYPELIGSFANYYFLNDIQLAQNDGLHVTSYVLESGEKMIGILQEVWNLIPSSSPFLMLDESPRASLIKGNGDYYGEDSYTMTYSFKDEDQRSLYPENQINFYYLRHDYEPPLLSGTMPAKEDEVIIDRTVADLLVKRWNLQEYQELLGKKINIGIFRFSDNGQEGIQWGDFGDEYRMLKAQYDLSDPNDLLCPRLSYTISGVSALTIEGSKNIFLKGDLLDNPLMDLLKGEHKSSSYVEKHPDPEYNSYHYLSDYGNMWLLIKAYSNSEAVYHCIPTEQLNSVYFDEVSFVLRPGSDYEQLLEEARSFFNLRYDSLAILGDTLLDDSQLFYKNITNFYPFIIAIIVLVTALPVILVLSVRKRERKERSLLKSYQYRLNVVYLIRYGLIALAVIVTALAVVFVVTCILNDYALAYNYVSFMNYDPLLIIILSIIMTAIYSIGKRKA